MQSQHFASIAPRNDGRVLIGRDRASAVGFAAVTAPKRIVPRAIGVIVGSQSPALIVAPRPAVQYGEQRDVSADHAMIRRTRCPSRIQPRYHAPPDASPVGAVVRAH
jgi:hypothetical protein